MKPLDAPPLSGHINWRNYGALVAAIAAAGLGLGTALPLSALVLDRWGIGSDVVGALAALSSLGILLVAPFVAGWAQRWSPRRLLVSACLAGAASIAVLDASHNLILWSAARLLFGAAMGVLFTLGEAWINRILPDAARGRYIGLYASVFTICQLGGPLIVELISDLPLPFVIAASLFLPAVPCVALLRTPPRTRADTTESPAPRLTQIAPRMLVIIAGTAYFALFDTVALSLLPLFGLRHGMPEAIALYATSVVIAGDTVLQPLLGLAADRYGRGRMHVACGIAALLAALALPYCVGIAALFWPCLIVLGGAAGGIYMLSLVANGERFSNGSLVAASAVMNISWGIAGIAGPLAAGAAMQDFGPDALPLVLAFCAMLFLACIRIEALRATH